MIKNIIYLTGLFICFSCQPNKKRNKHNDNALALSIDSVMNANYLANEPGAAIIITKEGKELYKKGFGMANMELNIPTSTDMIFRLGSISKQFTAISILILQEQGKLYVKDDIQKHLPNYPTHNKLITIEHLLTHSSGIPNFTAFSNRTEIEQNQFNTSELLDIFKDKPLDFLPGERFAYSNSGYNVLGAIIEKVSGVTYETFVETEIFDKLNMKHSFYDNPREIVKNKITGYDRDSLGYKASKYTSMCAPFSAGGLRSNVVDMAIWNKSLHEGKLIPVSSLQKAFLPYKLNSGKLTDYGFGWFVSSFNGHKLYYHNGGVYGFKTSGFFYPKEDVYILILSNNTSSNPGYLNYILSSLVLNEDMEQPIKIEQKDLAKYLGTYRCDGMDIRILKDSTDLLFDAPWQKGKLRYLGNNKFFIDETIISCSFNKDSTDSVKSLTINHRFLKDEWLVATRIK
jgi:CubicO group peptidase (beta-lactamase class C family)